MFDFDFDFQIMFLLVLLDLFGRLDEFGPSSTRLAQVRPFVWRVVHRQMDKNQSQVSAVQSAVEARRHTTHLRQVNKSARHVRTGQSVEESGRGAHNEKEGGNSDERDAHAVSAGHRGVH